jgi:hypothetical protein
MNCAWAKAAFGHRSCYGERRREASAIRFAALPSLPTFIRLKPIETEIGRKAPEKSPQSAQILARFRVVACSCESPDD